MDSAKPKASLLAAQKFLLKYDFVLQSLDYNQTIKDFTRARSRGKTLI